MIKKQEFFSICGVWGLSLSYFCLMTLFCKVAYDCFFYDADLAWSSHLLAWNAEKWPMFNVMSQTWLGDHFDPIGIILLPIFTLFPSAWVLLIFQNLAFATIPVLSFYLARTVLQHTGMALLVALLSVLNPALWYINLYNFHWVILTIPLTLGYFWALALKKSKIALGCLFVMMFCKEHTALLVVPLLLAHFVTFQQFKVFFSGIVTAIIFFLCVNVWLIPALGIQAPLYRWSYLGSTVPEIITGGVTQPQAVIDHLFIPENGKYLIDLLLPWGFLSLLNWRFLLAGVVFLTFGLSTDALLRNIQFQNASMLLGCLEVSAIYGLHWLSKTAKQGQIPLWGQRGGILLLIVISGYNFFYRSPQREGIHYYQHQLTHQGLQILWENQPICPDAFYARTLLEKLPQESHIAIVALPTLAVHLLSHPRLHLYDREHHYKDNLYLDFDYVIGNKRRGWYRSGREYHAFLTSLLNHPQWEMLYEDERDHFILKKVSSP